MNKRLFFFAGSAALLAGCSMAPNYERPAPPVASAYAVPASLEAVPAGGAVAPADLAWRDFLGDPRLQQLVQLALENNRDLRIAVLNVEQLRALYDIQRIALLPTLDATGSAARQRIPADLNQAGRAVTTSSYSVGLSVTSYELDLFGRVASLKDQALEQYFATEEARRSVQLTLIAAVANQYFVARALDEQLALARQTFESVNASFATTKRSFEVGVTSELDLRTAESQLQTARANVAVYQQQHLQALNALSVLVGRTLPDDLPAAQPLANASIVAHLPAGLPSDLLQRRPDLLQAEHELKAANANIGAARAAFFPAIKLTAFGGTSSAQLDGLFEGGSGSWSFAPKITLPIFAAGRNKANLDIAKLQKTIEIARYEKAIQVAFREVSDGLLAVSLLDEQIAAQAARVQAEEKRYSLSDLRYRKGVDSYVVLLSAQRDLYAAQQLLIQAQLARVSNLVGLYKALGGGWKE